MAGLDRPARANTAKQARLGGRTSGAYRVCWPSKPRILCPWRPAVVALRSKVGCTQFAARAGVPRQLSLRDAVGPKRPARRSGQGPALAREPGKNHSLHWCMATAPLALRPVRGSTLGCARVVCARVLRLPPAGCPPEVPPGDDDRRPGPKQREAAPSALAHSHNGGQGHARVRRREPARAH